MLRYSIDMYLPVDLCTVYCYSVINCYDWMLSVIVR